MNLPLPSLNFGLLAVALLISACDKSLAADEKRRRAEAGIRIDASYTASSVVAALRACEIVGVSGLTPCSQLSGTRGAELTAMLSAAKALNDVRSFRKDCQAVFAEAHCTSLLVRAIEIEEKKPRQPNAFD